MLQDLQLPQLIVSLALIAAAVILLIYHIMTPDSPIVTLLLASIPTYWFAVGGVKVARVKAAQTAARPPPTEGGGGDGTHTSP
jgi:hypothetical protein